jgi:DNA helicase-2/ATP-dependent DNA helicase PcrA
MFCADLHVHSRFARATSPQADLEHMALWAARKGLRVLGTGDFTHPAWCAELRAKLAPAEPGMFRLRPGIERALEQAQPGYATRATRFVLQVEVSTIWSQGGRVRKVHHLHYMPGFAAAARFIRRLGRSGNLAADGRPTLGLAARDLLELTLEADPAAFLVPAHIWTPWFSVLGSKSGFDAIEECYQDLTPHIFALETGLSSDPPMNWRVSALDRFRLVSNSDAHGPARIGREACVFDTALDFFSIRRALETGVGYGGTIEWFPEQGKYHLDGHRACGVCLEPETTRECQGLCPVCSKPVTAGVLHRVLDLADRSPGHPPAKAAPFRAILPLDQVLAEICHAGPSSLRVRREYERVLGTDRSELGLLLEAPLEAVARAGGEHLAEAVRRLRAGRVCHQPGYDGTYGTAQLFPAEGRDAERGCWIGERAR